MQEPTIQMRGSALGDYVGISWMLRDVGGTRIVGHGGTTIGQHSSFEMVPAEGFAVTSLTNSGPNGPEFNEEIVRWALESYVGVTWRNPEPVVVGDAVLAEYVGEYETIAVTCSITAEGGGLRLEVAMKPEVREQLGEEDSGEQPPFILGLLDKADEYMVTEGPAKGMRGYFVRGADGKVEGVHVGGRLARRTRESVPS